MPRKEKARAANTPAQPIDEIEEEIVGDAEEGEDGERPEVPVSRAKEVGAVNAEGVQSNRRRKTVLDRKRDGERNVPWGERDACLLYDDIISLWPPSHITIHVTRLMGSKISKYLTGQPRNGRELYEAVFKQVHGQSPETEYQVVFRDSAGRTERGRGYITIPSTELDSYEPMGPVGLSGPPPPMPAAPPPMPAPVGPPPAPSGGMEASVIMNLQRQLTEIQGALRGLGVQPAASAPAAPPPYSMPQPPPTPPTKVPEIPPGYALTTLGGMPVLVPMQGLGLAGSPAVSAATAPVAPAPPAAPPPTPEQQFVSTIGMARNAIEAVKSMQGLLPTAPAAEAPTPIEKEEDSPTKVVRIGEVNTVQNVSDGSIRPVDTLIANAPAILSWIDKQRNEYLSRQPGQAGQPPTTPTQGPQIGAPTIPGR